MLTTSEFKNYLFSTRNYQENYRFYFLRELLSGEKTYEQIVDIYIKENEKKYTKKELIKIFKDAPTKSLLKSGVIEVNKNKINLTIEPIDSSTKESYQWLLNKYIEIWNTNQSLKEVEVSDGLVIDEKKLIKFSEENNISYKKVIEITNSLINHRNKAVVLTGPPGTGKTYTIFKLIKFLQQQYGDKSSDASLTKLVQFHPSYGYEEFIRGLKPVVDIENDKNKGNLEFKSSDGKLINLINDSKNLPKQINISRTEKQRDTINSFYYEFQEFPVYDAILILMRHMGAVPKSQGEKSHHGVHYKDLAEEIVKAGYYIPYNNDGSKKNVGEWGEITINNFLNDFVKTDSQKGLMKLMERSGSDKGFYNLTKEGVKEAEKLWDKHSFKESQKLNWRDALVLSFLRLGGSATLNDLYEDVEKLGINSDGSSKDLTSTIRGRIYDNSSDSDAWGGKWDLFQKIDEGFWKLRNFKIDDTNSQIEIVQLEDGGREIVKSIQNIMDLQEYFEPEKSEKMDKRRELVKKLEDLINDFVLVPGYPAYDVKGRSQTTKHSLVPYVRIFHKDISPSAKSGLYVVILFDAKGESVYFTIGIGTENEDDIEGRVNYFQEKLKNRIDQIPYINTVGIDLKSDPKRSVRPQNYEKGTIAFIEYTRNNIQLIDERTFFEQLTTLLELLTILYELDSADKLTETSQLNSHLTKSIDETFGLSHFMVIDEINRGNLPKIFGELLNVFEYREEEVSLQYVDTETGTRNVKVPNNIYFLGTMNTADRGIRSIDFALRRRFNFIDFQPDEQALSNFYKIYEERVEIKNLVQGFNNLNKQIFEDFKESGENPKGYGIGHSFFIVSENEVLDSKKLEMIWNQNIFPLLEDYFFDRDRWEEKYTLETFWPEYKTLNMKKTEKYDFDTLLDDLNNISPIHGDEFSKISSWAESVGMSPYHGDRQDPGFLTGGFTYIFSPSENSDVRYQVFQISGQGKVRFYLHSLKNKPFFQNEDNKEKFVKELVVFIEKHNIKATWKNEGEFEGKPYFDLADLSNNDIASDFKILIEKLIANVKEFAHEE